WLIAPCRYIISTVCQFVRGLVDMLHPLVRADRACPEAAVLHKHERLMARGVSPLLSVRAYIYRHRPEPCYRP
ncbi:MAG TPA: hypothetical protein VGA09_21505, partial [Candidatus Binatia bacterium]